MAKNINMVVGPCLVGGPGPGPLEPPEIRRCCEAYVINKFNASLVCERLQFVMVQEKSKFVLDSFQISCSVTISCL